MQGCRKLVGPGGGHNGKNVVNVVKGDNASLVAAGGDEQFVAPLAYTPHRWDGLALGQVVRHSGVVGEQAGVVESIKNSLGLGAGVHAKVSRPRRTHGMRKPRVIAGLVCAGLGYRRATT